MDIVLFWVVSFAIMVIDSLKDKEIQDIIKNVEE